MNDFSRGNDYISSQSYVGYIVKRIRRGGTWNLISSVAGYIKKASLISAIVRVSGIIFALLEKSALLLLVFSSLVILLPAIAVTGIITGVACLVKYALYHKKITAWLCGCEKIIIYLTSSHTSSNPLFVRCAEIDAKIEYTKVIILCKGNFVAFCQYSDNILKIKPDYYFILKSLYLRKMSKKLIYIALA